MKGSFPLFVAPNPIKTLLRVMHRNFTLQVRFFWVLLENSVGPRSESVLCPGKSLNPSGEQSWSSLLFWKQSQKIFWHCVGPAGNNYQSSNFCMFFFFFFFLSPHNLLCLIILQFCPRNSSAYLFCCENPKALHVYVSHSILNLSL